MAKDFRKVDELKAWDKNPREITKEGVLRLRSQIKKLGQYKPLLITKDGTVLGGNMRLRAYKELGIDKVWVSEVDADTEERMIEYALSDNDRAGYYLEDELIALVKDIDIDMDDFAVDLGEMMSLTELLGKLDKFDEDYSQNLGEVIYEPKETNHQISDLYKRERKYDKDIKTIKNEKVREMLEARAHNFDDFDYPKIADYYAYQATPEEKLVFEKLAMVLLDRNKLIENGFSNLIDKIDLTEEEYES